MTLEKAAELVKQLQIRDRQVGRSDACELFVHFVEYFELIGTQREDFGRICGYTVDSVSLER